MVDSFRGKIGVPYTRRLNCGGGRSTRNGERKPQIKRGAKRKRQRVRLCSSEGGGERVTCNTLINPYYA